MTRVIAALGAGLVLLALTHQCLAAALIRADTVAGLISPQGGSLGGLLQVAAFLGVRLVLVLIVPGVVTGVALGWVGARASNGRGP